MKVAFRRVGAFRLEPNSDVPFVICYHSVSSEWLNPSTVPERVLEEQLALLKRRHYTALTVRELVASARSRRAPKKVVAVTFDDGYASTLRAKPILEAFGFPATVFVTTHFVESGDLLSWPGVDHWLQSPFTNEMRPLRWDELRGLASIGWEIGSHTVTHPHLPAVDDDQLEAELVASKRTIEAELGQCDSFAYPYGAYDDRVADAVRRAGYRAACTLSVASRSNDAYRLPRIGLYGRDHGLRLRLKLSPSLIRVRRSAVGAVVERALQRSRRRFKRRQSAMRRVDTERA